jgi:hypothetical protein
VKAPSAAAKTWIVQRSLRVLAGPLHLAPERDYRAGAHEQRHPFARR